MGRKVSGGPGHFTHIKEEPNFIPQTTQDGYGLYGHEAIAACYNPQPSPVKVAIITAVLLNTAINSRKYYSYDNRYRTQQQQPYNNNNMYNTEQSQSYIVARQYEQINPHNVDNQYRGKQEQYTQGGNSYDNFFENQYYTNGGSYNKEEQGMRDKTFSENEKYDHKFDSKKNYRSEYGNYYGNHKNKEKHELKAMEYGKSQNLYNP